MRPPILLALLVLSAPSFARQATLYSTNFTNLDGWTVTTGCYVGPPPHYAWAADATPATHPAGPFVSPPASLNFNNGIDIGGDGFHGGAAITCGWVTSDPIDLSTAVGVPRLRFLASWHSEIKCEWDRLSLEIRSATDGSLLFELPCINSYPNPTWVPLDVPLAAAWGEVRVRFGFETVDDWHNGYSGPFIDDLEVVDVFPQFTAVCRGDGSGASCPCANPGAAGGGCRNSTGSGAVLVAGGTAEVVAADLVLLGSRLPTGQFGTYLQGSTSLSGGLGVTFGDGLRCAGGAVVRLQQAQSNARGRSQTHIDIAARGGVAPGDTRTYQLWYRDPLASPCGSGFNFTNGIELTWLP